MTACYRITLRSVRPVLNLTFEEFRKYKLFTFSKIYDLTSKMTNLLKI